MTVARYPLELQFKGERNYIQGPDIFDAVLSKLCEISSDEIAKIDFSFHRMAHKAVDMICTEHVENLDPVAVCQYVLNGIRRRAYVVESSRDIDGRKPYQESEIVEQMLLNAEKAVCDLQCSPVYSDIEIWVAMTKALHQAALPELKGKWLFVRGKFDRYDPQDKGPRQLVIKSNFSNKLTRSDALRNGVKVGEIYFSLV